MTDRDDANSPANDRAAGYAQELIAIEKRWLIRLKRRSSLHTDSTKRLPWVQASGSPDTRSKKAKAYLRLFDYKKAAESSLDTEILARVVCNLRYYYRQNAEQTAELIMSLFNRKSWEVWSPEGIRFTWELVEGFTPCLGLADEKAKAKLRASWIEDEMVDLIAWTKPGGRVSSEDLRRTFQEWNPSLSATPRDVATAVKAVTGLTTTAIHGVRYWVGFHLPTADELAEPASVAA